MLYLEYIFYPSGEILNQKFDLPILYIFCFFDAGSPSFSFDFFFKQASGLPVGRPLPFRLPVLVDGSSSTKISITSGVLSTKNLRFLIQDLEENLALDFVGGKSLQNFLVL